MHTLLNTLYVMTPQSYVHLENSTVRIDVDHEKKLAVPLHHLGAIVCFGNIMVSPALMHRLADEGKSLVLLDDHGRFKARLEGPVSGNILLRQAHHACAIDAVAALAIARACVAGKVRNCRLVLRRVPVATDADQLRGIEGDAAKRYFSALPLLVRPDQRAAFTMDGRTRRPPLDRFNALISFLYAMLMNDCRSAVEAVGLDAQLGFLHAVRPGRAALALDLMEEFRPLFADRLALSLINRLQVAEKDFDIRPGGAVNLSTDARKAVVVAYQERKQDELNHPLLEQNVPVALLPLLQARMMARTVRGEMDSYLPFLAS